MKPFADMTQASSCRFFHVLLEIQITEQFSAFEDIGLGTAEPGGSSRQGLSAGDNAEPPPASLGVRNGPGMTEPLGGNLLCLQIRKASCFKHGVNNF